VRTLLETTELRPKVILAEAHEFIPPPIAYMEYCTINRSRPIAGCVKNGGCSLAAADDILSAFGYVLIQYDWPDGVWVHKDFSAPFARLTDGASPRSMFQTGYEHAAEHYRRMQKTYKSRKRDAPCFDLWPMVRRGDVDGAFKIVAIQAARGRLDVPFARHGPPERLDIYVV